MKLSGELSVEGYRSTGHRLLLYPSLSSRELQEYNKKEGSLSFDKSVMLQL
jgi:hypothetical protein